MSVRTSFTVFKGKVRNNDADSSSYIRGYYNQKGVHRKTIVSPNNRYCLQLLTLNTAHTNALCFRVLDMVAKKFSHYDADDVPLFPVTSKIICCYWISNEDVLVWMHGTEESAGKSKKFLHRHLIAMDHKLKKVEHSLTRTYRYKLPKEPRCYSISPVVIGNESYIVLLHEQSMCLLPYKSLDENIMSISYPRQYGLFNSVKDEVYVHGSQIFFATSRGKIENANEMVYLDLASIDTSQYDHYLNNFQVANFDGSYYSSFGRSHNTHSLQYDNYVVRWNGDLKSKNVELYVVDLKNLRIAYIDAHFEGLHCAIIYNDGLLMLRNVNEPFRDRRMEPMQFCYLPNVVNCTHRRVPRLATACLNVVLMSKEYTMEEREFGYTLFNEGVVHSQ